MHEAVSRTAVLQTRQFYPNAADMNGIFLSVIQFAFAICAECFLFNFYSLPE